MSPARYGARVCEGAFWLSSTAPFQVPYGTILPKRLGGLLVPVAASATHVGYSALRMEPVRMALGQAAGTAAALAVHLDVSPRRVPIALLQYRLARQGQMLRYWSDVTWHSKYGQGDRNRRDFVALQVLGGRSLVGSAGNFQVHPNAAVTGSQLTQLLDRIGRRPTGLGKLRTVSRRPVRSGGGGRFGSAGKAPGKTHFRRRRPHTSRIWLRSGALVSRG